MSNKSFRIRTKPGGDDNYIRVKLDQDFNQLKILSLSIDQEDLYRSFNANYGVVAGRVDINNGFGLKNAKVSIFIPLSSEDQENEVISQLYPYKSLEDLNSNGVRYNLLPRKQQHIDHTPTGTFPDKRQILDSPTMVEVYDKYYKFTTTTNESGDYMFFGVPVGSQQVFIDVDVSDIGFLSARPYELMSQGIPKEKFESKFKFKSSSKLDELPQVISTSTSIDVLPFWADDLSKGTQFGITRFDYSVTEYELTPTAIFMGSMFSDNENDALSKNCRPRKKMGEMNELITGAGKIEAITRTKDGDIVLSKDIPEDAVDENGNWAIQVPMTMRKLVTDEFGALVPSPDGKRGVASEADYRFRISMEPNKDDKKKRTRAKLLVPNMTNNYKFGEFSKIDLTNAEAAGEPIFKINKQLSYDTTNGPLNQYNYLEDFFTFRWKKIYTVRQYIPRYQPNKNDKNKNFIGFKEILDGAGVNKIPYNRIFARVNIIYSILCIILTIFGFIVAFVNTIIQFINALISRICQIRIPFPCIDFSKSAGECKKLKYKFDVQKYRRRNGGGGDLKWRDDNLSGNVSKNYANYSTNAGVEKVSGKGNCWIGADGDNASWSGLKSWLRYGSDDKDVNGLPAIGTQSNWTPRYSSTTIKGSNDNQFWYSSPACRQSDIDGAPIEGCYRVKFKSGIDVYKEDTAKLSCDKPAGWGGFAINVSLFGLTSGVCIKVLFKLIDVCILKGLCNTCSNDNDYGGTGSNDGDGAGVNKNCCSGCKDCDDNPNVSECGDNCLQDCCEKIKPISLKCAEEDIDVAPVISSSRFESKDDGGRSCGKDELTKCFHCAGKSTYPIADWVACKLERLATRLGMLDFEFYNDWMNGSLYFPLIKRKLKIKRAKKAAKGKSTLR